MMENSPWRRHPGGWIMKGTVMMVTMVMVIHHTSSADLTTLIQLTARSVQERPERAALEPPTVTSLRPPDRNKSGRIVNVSVPSEQSGSHIPPVVASRSPSRSSNSKDYNSRYIHMNPRFSQPSAPVATASSRSRAGHVGGIAGRRSFPHDHQRLPAPTPHLVNGTSVSTPQESSWVPPRSYAPPRSRYGSSGYSPVARSYPRNPRIHEGSAIPKPSYVNEMPKENNPGGVWGQTDGNPTGGIWEGDTRKQPSYPQGHHRSYSHSITEDTFRPDTFGHSISEDFSHLRTEYSPRSSSSRTSHIQPPQHGDDVYPPSRGNRPREENIHLKNHNNHHQNGNYGSNFPTDDFRGQRPSSSHPSRSIYTESSRNHDSAPTSYGSARRVPTYSRESTSQNGTFTQHSSVSEFHPHTSSPNRNDRIPLTFYEVMQMNNMSDWDEFTAFLKRKGLTITQVLNYVNEGATKQELLDFFHVPDLTTTVQPSVSTDSYHKSRPSQKSSTFEDIFSESIVHEIKDEAFFNPTSSIITDTTEENDEGRHKQTKKEKKKRRKGRNKKRGRKNKDKKRKRDRKDKKQTLPDSIYTTIISQVDTSKNESVILLTQPDPTFPMQPVSSTPSTTVQYDMSSAEVIQGPSSSTVPLQSTVSTFANHSLLSVLSTEVPILSQVPIITFPSEQSTTEHTQNFTSHNYVTAVETTTSLHSTFSPSAVTATPTETSWPQSISFPSTTQVSLTTATTIKPISLPALTTQGIPTYSEDAILPAISSSDFSEATKATPQPTSEGPKVGSLTRPPSSKTSEVSIISFTVMEVPTHNTQKETVLEDSTLVRKRQNHRKSRKKTHKSHPKRIYSPPRLLPSIKPKKTDDEMVIRTPYIREGNKDNYTFPVKGFMIITGIMGALAVFTLVVLISYAIIKCSKPPVVNNYQVSEQKPATQ